VHPFEYQKPTDEQASDMAEISLIFRQCYDWIEEYVKPSAERTLAIRKLQETRMWTNVAILGIQIKDR
jgi:hypothetical protein